MTGFEALTPFFNQWPIVVPLDEGAIHSNLSMRQMKQKHFYHPWGGTTEVNVSYEQNLKVTDDRPPTTVITHAVQESDGRVRVRGTTADASAIQHVLVNGKSASADEQGQWEVVLDGWPEGGVLEATAEDALGNKELRSHKMRLGVKRG